MRISDWSSDVCSSDLRAHALQPLRQDVGVGAPVEPDHRHLLGIDLLQAVPHRLALLAVDLQVDGLDQRVDLGVAEAGVVLARPAVLRGRNLVGVQRSEEHTSELQSLMRISYAVFCLKKKKDKKNKAKTKRRRQDETGN